MMRIPARALLATLLVACADSPGEPAAPEAAQLVPVDGDGQRVTVMNELPRPLAVRVLDGTGAPVPGVPVRWTVLAGGGSLAATAAASDSAGVARARWTLGPLPGEQEASAEAEALEPVRFGATALPGAASTLELVAGADQSGVAGTAVPVSPAVRVLDELGNPVPAVLVRFEVTAGGGWTVADSARTDGRGEVAMAWYLGPHAGEPQRLRIRAGPALTVEVAASAHPPEPGAVHFGRAEYIEYIPGTLPVVVSAPHGGHLRPSEIPDRTWGTTVRDANTQELARQIGEAFIERTGESPHIVICRLHRVKVDANRDLLEAAQGRFFAEWAWREFHGFVEAAKAAVAARHGRGLFIDLHGHAHPIARLELGYLLRSDELALPDSVLDASDLARESSIRTLAETSGVPFSDLLRGPGSLGTRLEALGYPAVPSAPQPDPAGEPYFNGGYNTHRHGSLAGGPIDGVQIEAHYAGVRDTHASRAAFAQALAEAVEAILTELYAAQPAARPAPQPVAVP